MDITIREIGRSEIDRIFTLYGEVFGADKLKIWKKRFQWEFYDNPRTKKSPSVMWVAENDAGDFIGFIASFPMLLKVGHDKIMTSSSGDLMVFPAGRRKGVAQKVSKAYRDSCDTLATDGFGYQPITGRIYRKLNYEPVYCEPIYTRPFNMVKIFDFFIDSGRLPQVFENDFLKKAGRLLAAAASPILQLVDWLVWPKNNPKIEVKKQERCPADVDVLWNEISKEFPVVFVRDQKFIQWRFFDDPVTKHHFLAARDHQGKLLGYLVFCVTIRRNMKVARIMDIFCSTKRKDVVETLLHHALTEIKEKSDIVSVMGLHPSIRAHMKRFIFLRVKHEEIPALLYFNKGPEKQKRLIFDKDMWHLSSADGDEGLGL